MTVPIDSFITDPSESSLPDPTSRPLTTVLWEQFKAMSRAMVEEEGLLNYPQAGILLNVSTKRITELVRLGKLKRFDFVGRTYVSFREVRERCEQEVQAGRPRRKMAKRVANALKAAAKMDLPQFVMEGLVDYEIKDPEPIDVSIPPADKGKNSKAERI